MAKKEKFIQKTINLFDVLFTFPSDDFKSTEDDCTIQNIQEAFWKKYSDLLIDRDKLIEKLNMKYVMLAIDPRSNDYAINVHTYDNLEKLSKTILRHGFDDELILFIFKDKKSISYSYDVVPILKIEGETFTQ